MTSGDTIERLAEVLVERRRADPAESYVAGLYAGGAEAMLKKIGEEATELVMAGKDARRDRIVSETADLWFHCLVMLIAQGIDPRAVLAELERRLGTSGLTEKAARVETR